MVILIHPATVGASPASVGALAGIYLRITRRLFFRFAIYSAVAAARLAFRA
jgi:hypothetical protein